MADRPARPRAARPARPGRCSFRPEHHFAGGADDKRGWQRWLVVAVLTVPILVGFLLLIGYYHVVIRRNSPFSRGGG